MKRSEMLKRIKSIIATCGPTQPTIKTARQVLQACEVAGMLPPVVEGLVAVETDGGQLVVRPWRWEDEITASKLPNQSHTGRKVKTHNGPKIKKE